MSAGGRKSSLWAVTLPADVLDDQEWGVACGWSTGVHEVATLFALTQSPCQKWEALGYGKATLPTNTACVASRQAAPCPSTAVLGCLRPTEEADPPHFTVNGFSAGSCTGAVIASAIRCLWRQSDHGTSRSHCHAEECLSGTRCHCRAGQAQLLSCPCCGRLLV